MIGLFGNNFKGLLKLSETSIDNNIFKLHYKATFIILYLGDPIDCIVHTIKQDVMDTYCWIHSTFSISNNDDQDDDNDVPPHPGVRPEEPGGAVRHHKYYQWVCFALFFQALFFYVPHHLWKVWEGGTMKLMVRDLNVPIVDPEVKRERIGLVVDYFTQHQGSSQHGLYAARFFVCELLNLVNVVCQIFFVDVFLGGEFSSYGVEVLAMTEMEPEDRFDPMARVFPKVTKCTFKRFGPTGTIEKFDALCVLPLNIINEKIYVFLWFWLILVAILTSLHLVYRSATLLLPRVRVKLLHARAGRLVHAYQLQALCLGRGVGDWFLLYQMSKNMDQLVFKEFVERLHRTLEEKEEEEMKGMMIA